MIPARDTGPLIACCERCQLAITWMPKIKDEAMVNVLISYFSRYWRMDVRTYGLLRDKPNFLDRWVTKFSKVWSFA